MLARLSIAIGIPALFFAGLFLLLPGSASAACAPASSDQAILYQNNECEGDSLPVASDLSNLKNVSSEAGAAFNDKTSSLVVGENKSVTLYEHIDYGGNTICWNGPAQITRLDDYEIVEDNGWDNDASSVRVDAKAAETCTNPGAPQKVDDETQCGGGIGGVFCRLGTVGNLIKNLPITGPTLFIVLTVVILASFAEIVAGALSAFIVWFAKEAINIPVVASKNEFIEQGFQISLTIVNSIFILVLVVIGLATILRWRTYQFQKLLPVFILVALLINFSGVLVGFVVDIGNLLTNFFLGPIGSLKMEAQTIGSLGGDIWSYLTSPGFDELFGNLVGVIAKSIIILLYNLVLFLVLFVLFIIFVVRTSVLSLLAVLAPFAFAAYILPGTRKFATQWWGLLIQWSLIGAPIAFFLYLSNLFLIKSPHISTGGLEGAGALGEVIAGIVNPLASIILLIAGIGISMQLAPASARAAIKYGRKAPKWLANTRLGARVMGGLSSGTQKTLAGAATRLGEWEKKTGPFRPVAAVMTRPLGWATTGLNKAAGPKLMEYAASKRKFQLPKGWDQMGTTEQTAYLKEQNLGHQDLVQGAAKMGKNLRNIKDAEFNKKILEARDKSAGIGHLRESVGTINDLMPETVTKDVLIDMETALGVGRADATRKLNEKLEEIMQQVETDERNDRNLREALADQVAPGKKYGTREGLAVAIHAAKSLKPQEWANVLDPDTLSSRLALRDGNPENLRRVQESSGRETLDNIFDKEGGINGLTRQQLEDPTNPHYNPQLVKFLTENPAGRAMPWNPAGQAETLRAEVLRQQQEITRVSQEIAQRQQQIQTLRQGRPTATPGNRAIPRADRETIERLEDEIRRLEEELRRAQSGFEGAREQAEKARQQRGSPRPRGPGGYTGGGTGTGRVI